MGTSALSVLLPDKIFCHMRVKTDLKKTVLITVIQFVFIIVLAQPGVPFTKWTSDGTAYYQVEKGEIFKIELPSQKKDTIIRKKQLTTSDGKAIVPRSFQLSADGSKALIYTNAKKVWRYPTRGDYWLLTLSSGN
jgi:dipeptidyl-peptidase-4